VSTPNRGPISTTIDQEERNRRMTSRKTLEIHPQMLLSIPGLTFSNLTIISFHTLFCVANPSLLLTNADGLPRSQQLGPKTHLPHSNNSQLNPTIIQILPMALTPRDHGTNQTPRPFVCTPRKHLHRNLNSHTRILPKQIRIAPPWCHCV
jgi:hypothetical protein